MEDWIVCQLGAREDYAVARALHQQGRLAGLVTDAWAPPDALGSAPLPQRLRERWQSELSDTRVIAPTICSSVQKVWSRARRRSGWRSIMTRNLWFQKAAARRLKSFSGDRHTIFSYSYAAGEIFAEAKHRGWRTVLGQIDPGPVEARLVAKLYKEAGQKHVYEEIPEAYWDSWHREVDLADRIVVNSQWSRQALIGEGLPEEKLKIIPLAYERESEKAVCELPKAFSAKRPLKLLFLGQVTLRKGINLVFEAMLLLPDLPLQLDVVGPIQVDIPEKVHHDRRLKIRGAVPRSQTEAFYKEADLFLFPTYSDGFGLTQLEAMAAGLPVVASRFCGDVVRDGINGRVLQVMEADELADIIRELAEDPGLISRLQEKSYVEKRFHLDAIGKQYEELMP